MMKENYLWDKTGQNAEIERLENALKAFRYQETAAPALPAKIVSFEKAEKKPLWNFPKFSLAFAAFAAVMIVCFGVWFQFSSRKIEVAKDSPEKIAPQISETIATKISIQKPGSSIAGKVEKIEKPEPPKQFAARKIIKIRPAVPANIRQNDLMARVVEAKKPAVKLTKEETYAYNQLMLALSITGSKLKLVTDKIDRAEEKTIVREDAR